MSACIASAHSIAFLGLEGYGANVEAHVGRGLVTFTLVGLPDASLREAKDRVRSALQVIGCEALDAHITVNLSPAGLPKSGSGLDLVAVAVIFKAAEVTHPQAFVDTILLAEFGLDGGLRPIKDTLSVVTAAEQIGAKCIIVVAASTAEASLVTDIEVLGFDHLVDVIVWARGRASKPQLLNPAPMRPQSSTTYRQAPDLVDVCGQDITIDALEVVAARGHHPLLIGEPGMDKAMLVSRFPSISPPLEEAVALQAIAIHSLTDILPQDSNLIRTPPFRTSHHSMTTPVPIGGGSGIVVPGAVSPVHGGVLFLDEAAEFSPSALDSLCQPLEERFVTIHRSKASARYPSTFQLVLVLNSCPYGHGGRAYRCTSMQRKRYASRFSGPLLDRIDVTIAMRQPTKADLRSSRQCFSAEVRRRAEEAGARGVRRLKDTGWKVSPGLPGAWVRHSSGIPERSIEIFDWAADEGIVTIHGADRILRLMWTLAGLRERPLPNDEDLARVLMLRNGGFNAN